MAKRTPGKTGSEKAGNLLDETVGSEESIVLVGKLLDELLVPVQLLEVLSGHAIDAVVLSTVEIVLVTKNTVKTWVVVSASLLCFNICVPSALS